MQYWKLPGEAVEPRSLDVSRTRQDKVTGDLINQSWQLPTSREGWSWWPSQPSSNQYFCDCVFATGLPATLQRSEQWATPSMAYQALCLRVIQVMTFVWTLALLMQLCHFWLCFSNVLCGSTNCWRLLCWTEDGIYTLAEQGKQLWLPFTVSYKPQCSRASGLHQVISIIGPVPPPRKQERARLRGASIPAWLLPSPPGHGACTSTLCTPLCTASKGLGDYMKPNVQVCFVGWFGQHNSPCLGKAIRWQRSKQEMNHQFSARISKQYLRYNRYTI